MATIIADSIYNKVKDPIYKTLQSKVPTDVSTRYRMSKYITGKNTSDALGLNVNAVTTEFEYSNRNFGKLRWDTSCLVVKCKCNNQTVDTNMTEAVPSFTAVFDQMESITLTSQNGSKEIFKITDVSKTVLAKALTTYDWDTLNNMDSVFFTPLEESQDAFGYDFTSGVCRNKYSYVGADGTSGQIAAGANGIQFSLAQMKRGVRHQTNIHGHIKVFMIPLNVILPRLPQSIVTNLQDFKVAIQWKNNSTSRGIESIIGDAHTAGLGKILITSCEFNVDNYVPQIPEESSITAEKSNKVRQIIGYTELETKPMNYVANAEMDVGNVKNLQAIMLVKDMYGATNASSTAATQFVYKSTCQFSLFDNQKGYAASTVMESSNEVNALNSMISSIQVSYGDDILYPNKAISTLESNCPVLQELYYEYLKALNNVDNRIAMPMPFSVFSTVMPFVFIRFYPNDAVHLCREGKRLIIKMTGGISTNLTVICFTHKNIVCEVDNSISEFQ